MHPSRTGERRCKAAFVILLLCLSLVFPAGAAEDDLDFGKVYAIQDRAYRMNQEFSVGLAFLPLDAFYKFFAVSFHYVLHFEDLWAWETHFGFAKYMDVDTGLHSELNTKWDVSPTETPKINYFLDTNLMLKPLYGKMTLFDSLVINSETYFLLGIGAQNIDNSWAPALDIGTGMRIFLSNSISMRFEARDYIYYWDGGVDNSLYLGISFCYNGFSEDRKIKSELEDESSEGAEVTP
jgi:outer membrane beta-barrel protein